jgi:hypothetical protein
MTMLLRSRCSESFSVEFCCASMPTTFGGAELVSRSPRSRPSPDKPWHRPLLPR